MSAESVVAVETSQGLLAFDADGNPQQLPTMSYGELLRQQRKKQEQHWIEDSCDLSMDDSGEENCTVTNPFTGVEYIVGPKDVTALGRGEQLWKHNTAPEFLPYSVFLDRSDHIVLYGCRSGEEVLITLDSEGRKTGVFSDQAIYVSSLLPDGSIICDLPYSGAVVRLARDCTETWRVAVPTFICPCHTAYGIAVAEDGTVFYFGQYETER